MSLPDELENEIGRAVAEALAEDAGCSDLSASLIDADMVVGASIIAGESLVLAGAPWVDAVFSQLDDRVIVDWYVCDGQHAEADDVVCKLVGPARALLAGERSAMSFLRILSATATQTSACVAAAGTRAQILDTPHTLPTLRQAQAYAVTCGGGGNAPHPSRDALLIDASHIKCTGSIRDALANAGALDNEVRIAVAVQTCDELREALEAGAARVLLVGFTTEELRQAVSCNADFGYVAAELEASGKYSPSDIAAVAATGVDYISTTTLTQTIDAIDLSMIFRIDQGR